MTKTEYEHRLLETVASAVKANSTIPAVCLTRAVPAKWFIAPIANAATVYHRGRTEYFGAKIATM
jgi:hypothetical protein